MEDRLYPGCSTDENPGAPITIGPAWQAVVRVRSGKESTPRMGSHAEEGVPLPLLLALPQIFCLEGAKDSATDGSSALSRGIGFFLQQIYKEVQA